MEKTSKTVTHPDAAASNESGFRRRFEVTAELAGDGLLIVDGEGVVVFAGESTGDLLGYPRDALEGSPLDTLLTPAGFTEYRRLRDEAARQPGRRSTGEFSFVPAWQQEIEVEAGIIVATETAEAYLSLRDVSLAKLMERKTQQSNQFLRNIIMNSADGIVATDVSGNILLFNQGASRMLGWTEAEVIGRKNAADMFEPGATAEIMRRLTADNEEDGPRGLLDHVEVNVITKQGESIPVGLSLSSINEWDREVARVGIFTDLRQRVAMERELKATRDYLNNVVENAFDMIMTTDLDRRIVSLNRGGERMLGYQRDELIGAAVEDLYVNPAERVALLRRMEHFDGAVTNYETRLKHRNGSVVDISLTLSLLHDNEGRIVGTVGISKDITAQKKAQAELRATKDYLNAIVENTPDMIITTGLDRSVVSFNRGAELMLGYRREEVLGRDIEELYVDPDERRALAKLLSDMEDSVTYETQLRDKEGRVVDIDLTLSHLRDQHGGILGTVGISKDITEKKRVEKELEEKKAELEEAQLQIMHAEKMASLGKLATSVAHEINNPLGGILLFCEMILEEMAEEDSNRPDVIQIREQTMRCRDIVKGLLEFGRMTGTHYSFIDLNRTVEQGIALFANQAIFQNIEVRRELASDLPQIMGDSSQLNQVFTNLIINAVDAMEGSGVLTIRTNVDYAAEEVRVIFSDTGRGIDAEDRARIFEPFYTTKPVGEGVGLGLSTSYGIVRKHGGRLEVESEVGVGSTFIVILPLEGPEQE